MLKALELIGFKSFADKTRFDFSDGITVVVGPNGSGKSNIVDAIKWVLGAQSAKSLRGSDMIDVIFKGSAAGGRKPANSAEATLVFDNSKSQLAIDAVEVYVTRRVYRSGESEYLINRQPCRLKDIKDLFRGTGVGVDSYSLIEQGKVDRMLQASPKDRRAIFEEAAGISRFKAKKLEAEKRLARVDQNLLRLGDIVDEVRTRFESLQNQAVKARRYREMTQRLSLLRTQIGLAETNSLRATDAGLRKQQAQLLHQCAQIQAENESARGDFQQVELKLQRLASHAHETQLHIQDVRASIATLESTRRSHTLRCQELENEQSLLQTRLHALRQRAVLTGDEVGRGEQELVFIEQEHATKAFQLKELEAHRVELDARSTSAQHHVESIHESYMDVLRQISDQATRIATENQTLSQIEQLKQEKSDALQQADQHLSQLHSQLETLERAALDSQSRVETTRQAWQASLESLDSLRQTLVESQDEAIALQGRSQGTRERLSVLEQLEQQQEGVGRGAKQLIHLASQQQGEPWSTVKGLVADLIEIDVHLAPLIDVALGGAAETVVLMDGQVIQLLRDGLLTIDGRVSLLRMDRLANRRTTEKIQLDGLRGVIGRADRLVRCQDEYQFLVRSLLGSTWLVDSLATALDLSHLRGAGLKFVTASCERIDADGTLTLGALKSALGLVARRSEMQAAREEIRHYELRIGKSAEKIGQIQTEIQAASEAERTFDEVARTADKAFTELRLQTSNQISRIAQVSEDRAKIEREMGEVMASQLEVVSNLASAMELAGKLELQAAEAKALVEHALASSKSIDIERREHAEAMTSHRVLLAKIEQRLESHRAILEQLARDHQERHLAVEDAHLQLATKGKRRLELDLEILRTTSELALLYLDVEGSEERMRELAFESASIQAERNTVQKRVDSLQRQLDKNRERQSQLAMELGHVEVALNQILARFRDDYQLDLLDRSLTDSTPILVDREEAESESSRLRQEIAQVGAVNMEALRELDELQTRYDTLSGHYRDLTDARDTLLKIIAKINQDSRRLFTETLDAIRQNFQVLYKKSFGGGHADILLEEGEDVLECGVEIVATPPGKTSLSNSLLSGGEKALTAVALIMAIFQFRPSPFCVLDEVDAPFDEANIGRFVSVLKEFLDWTKFIVVTHSKKTMTAANTLYGVTMQESGVSTQVSVRFEDVGDDGEILKIDNPRRAA